MFHPQKNDDDEDEEDTDTPLSELRQRVRRPSTKAAKVFKKVDKKDPDENVSKRRIPFAQVSISFSSLSLTSTSSLKYLKYSSSL